MVLFVLIPAFIVKSFLKKKVSAYYSLLLHYKRSPALLYAFISAFQLFIVYAKHYCFLVSIV